MDKSEELFKEFEIKLSYLGKEMFNMAPSSVKELKEKKGGWMSQEWLIKYGNIKLEIASVAQKLSNEALSKLINICTLIDMGFTNIFEANRVVVIKEISESYGLKSGKKV